METHTVRAAVAATIVALALAGCASAPAVDDGTLQVVASTNVYGDIAHAIGGAAVTVTSLISSAAQDPHSFEASARDQLSVAHADVIVANGGGYDPFVETLVAASGTSAVVVVATDVVGMAEGANEHIWYSLSDMDRVASQLADTFSELDPAHSAAYQSNYEVFADGIRMLTDRASALTVIANGAGVVITEPVPLYLLEASGLRNLTPVAFTEAIEEGGDVPPSALLQTLALFDDAEVAVLAYNEQTASRETQRVLASAEAGDVPVAYFTETLPDGL
ncbi:MAG: zinc ABC transporter substrate-binding protein, partial [Rhodoglobus sp.]